MPCLWRIFPDSDWLFNLKLKFSKLWFWGICPGSPGRLDWVTNCIPAKCQLLITSPKPDPVSQGNGLLVLSSSLCWHEGYIYQFVLTIHNLGVQSKFIHGLLVPPIDFEYCFFKRFFLFFSRRSTIFCCCCCWGLFITAARIAVSFLF